MRSCPDEGRSKGILRFIGSRNSVSGEAAADNGVRKLVKLAEFPRRVTYDKMDPAGIVLFIEALWQERAAQGACTFDAVHGCRR